VKILIADDEAISRKILESRLGKWGYDVVVATDGTEAWNALQGPDAPSLAILDWEMPGMDGVEVCRRLRQVDLNPQGRGPELQAHYVYVILLTSKTRGEDMVAGMEAGADDYVAKPFDANELKVRLRAGRRILDLVAELVRARELLADKATRDSLTSLWNRGAILEALEREMARSDRENAPLGILMADIDLFKRVNDTFGHLAGDAVLRETARRMLAARRPYDAVGRYGGEEFLILAPGCGMEAARGVGERMRAAIAAEPMNTADGLIPVTMSLGAACRPPRSGVTAEALLRTADEALYRAKANGRNRVEAGG
jgi:diguanylate cyclase (GGDEF)-like protein